MVGLFGPEFDVNVAKTEVKKLLKKVNNTVESTTDAEKQLKSKKLSVADRLSIVSEKVLRVLGKQRKNIVVIRDLQTFNDYISKALSVGKISIDTETNNSLDPVTCQLMGLCLHIPGEKQAYIPVNHTDLDDNKLPNQLTEEDCRQQLQRLVDNNTFIIMHNGKFDYEVIKCTCKIEVKPTWDTMVAARLLNENEPAGLKYQYTTHIDPTQEKYDIEGLFDKLNYAYVDPETFALYAATDSLMTTKLYEWQLPQMTGKDNERVYWVFKNIEMPIVIVTAEMELRGVKVDKEFGDRLKVKYNKILEKIDAKISTILDDIKPIIEAWKETPEATEKARMYVPKKTKMSQEKIEATYTLIDPVKKERYKETKSKLSQLEDPINLASPAQLAILFFDILSVDEAYKTDSRATGKNELKAMAESLKKYVSENKKEELDQALENSYDDEEDENSEPKAVETDEVKELNKLTPEKAEVAANLCSLLLERRGIVKLITTYIDVIPDLTKHWPDGRIRFHLNSMGTDTGRYSSGGKIKYIDPDTNEPVTVSGINIQNIPSRGAGKITRCLFKAKVEEKSIEEHNNCYEVNEISEVETPVGWKFCKDLKIGDYICTDEGQDIIINIEQRDKTYYIYAEKYHLGL